MIRWRLWMNREDKFLQESNAIEGVYDDQSLIDAWMAWRKLKKVDELSIGTILSTHKQLMLNQPIPGFQRGYFRLANVQIGSYMAIEPSKILYKMRDWVKDVMTSIEVPGDDGHHIKLNHIDFEKIHPFIDGNGRIGRMLMNWQRLKVKLPILVIKESKKQKYYEWFNDESKT